MRLTNVAGSLVRETDCDAEGNFRLEAVSTGQYKLTAESETFVSVIVEISLATGQQKEIDLRFKQMASVLQAITVVASAPSSLTPDPSQMVVIHDQVLDANPGDQERRFQFPGCRLKRRQGELKHHNILRLVWREITANRLRNSFKSETSYFRIICRRMHTATAIRIQMF